MKGTITAFDPTSFRGSINAHDGNEYEFTAQDWREGRKAKPGLKVDFQIDGAQAHEIVLDDRVAGLMAQYPGPVVFHPSLMARAESLGGALVLGVIALVCLASAGSSKSMTPLVILEAAGVFFCGLVAVAGLILALVPGLSSLRLDKDGYEKKEYFSTTTVTWHASQLTPPASGKKSDLTKTAGSVFKIGGLSRVDLKRLMTRWCERALKG